MNNKNNDKCVIIKAIITEIEIIKLLVINNSNL